MKKSFNKPPRVLEDAKNFALRQPKSKSKSPGAPHRRNTLHEREMREAFTGQLVQLVNKMFKSSCR